jgi:hypothetical protein
MVPQLLFRYITSSFTTFPSPADGGLSATVVCARNCRVCKASPYARQVCTGKGEKSSPTSQNWTMVCTKNLVRLEDSAASLKVQRCNVPQPPRDGTHAPGMNSFRYAYRRFRYSGFSIFCFELRPVVEARWTPNSRGGYATSARVLKCKAMLSGCPRERWRW